MKMTLKTFAVVAVMSLLAGCADETYLLDSYYPSTEPCYYNLSTQFLSFPYIGGTNYITLSQDNISHHFSELPEWLTMERSEDSYDVDEFTYIFTAAPNYQAESRTGIFDLFFTTNNGNYSFTLPMTAEQSGMGYYLQFADTNNSTYSVDGLVSARGGTVDVALKSNCPVITVSSGENGVTGSYNYHTPVTDEDVQTLTITLPENTSTSTRSINVYITSEYNGSITLVANIRQRGVYVDVNVSSHTFPAAGGTLTVNVSSDNDWTVDAPADNWCSATVSGSTIVIQAAPNHNETPRSSTVNIRVAGQIIKTLEINQSAPAIQASPATIEIPYTGGTATVTVESDVAWDKVTAPSWITVGQNSGQVGTTSVNITVGENTAVNPRTGKLVFTRDGWTTKAEVTVTQLAFVPELSANTLEFERAGGARTITINAPSEWTIVADDAWPDWLTATPMSGSGASTVTFTAATNSSSQERHAQLYVDFGSNKREPVSITQRGPYIDVNSSNLEFSVFGGSNQVSYSTNVVVDFSIEPAADWVSLQTLSQGEVRVTTQYNNSIEARDTYLVISSTESDITPLRLHITQAERTVEASTTAVNVFYYGGKTQSFSVVAVGELNFALEQDGDWVTMNVNKLVEPTNTACGVWAFDFDITENPGETTRTANFIISLADLPEGMTKQIVIPVRQYGRGVVIELDGWGEDNNWNGGGNFQINLDLNNDWGEDNNWN